MNISDIFNLSRHGLSASASVVILVLVIDPYAFREDQLDAFLADTVAKMYKFTCLAWGLCRKLRHSAEVLIIRILTPLLHYALVRQIPDMLQYEQPHHQANRFGRPSIVFTKQRFERIVEYPPVDPVCESEQWMGRIKHLGQTAEK